MHNFVISIKTELKIILRNFIKLFANLLKIKTKKVIFKEIKH
jgi:hypothetical protein